MQLLSKRMIDFKINVYNYYFFSYFFSSKSQQWQLYFVSIRYEKIRILDNLMFIFYRIQEMVDTSAGVVIKFCSRSLAEIPAEGSHHSDHALLHHGHLSNCFPAGHEMEWNNLGGLVDSSIPASHGVCPRGYGK